MLVPSRAPQRHDVQNHCNISTRWGALPRVVSPRKRRLASAAVVSSAADKAASSTETLHGGGGGAAAGVWSTVRVQQLLESVTHDCPLAEVLQPPDQVLWSNAEPHSITSQSASPPRRHHNGTINGTYNNSSTSTSQVSNELVQPASTIHVSPVNLSDDVGAAHDHPRLLMHQHAALGPASSSQQDEAWARTRKLPGSSRIQHGTIAKSNHPRPGGTSSSSSNIHERAGSMSGQQLTSSIKACRNWYQLRALLAVHGTRLNHIHVTACCSHLASIAGHPMQPKELLELHAFVSDMLLPAAMQLLQHMGPRELCTCLHGLASIGLCPSDMWMSQYSCTVTAGLGQYNARDLSTTVWALGKIASGPGRPWAHHASAATAATPVALPPRAVAGPGLVLKFLEALFQQCSARLEYFGPQDLSLTIVGLSNLRHVHQPDAQWQAQYLDSSYARLRSCSPQALANMVHSMALLAWQPSGAWLERFGQVSYQQFAACSPQALALIAGSVQNLGWRPPAQWCQRLLQRVHEQLDECNEQDLTEVVMALHGLSAQPSEEWFVAVEEVLCSRWKACSPKQLSNTMLGLVRVGHQPGREALGAWMAQVHARASHLNPTDIAHCLWSIAELGLVPPAPWVEQLVAVARQQLGHAPVTAKALLVWSLSRISYRPSWQFMLDFYAATEVDMAIVLESAGCWAPSGEASSSSSSSSALSSATGRGIAVGNVNVGAGTASVVQGAADEVLLVDVRRGGGMQGQLGGLKGQDVSMMAAALAKLKSRPLESWGSHFLSTASLLLAREQLEGAELASIAWAIHRLRLHPDQHLAQQLMSAACHSIMHLPPRQQVLMIWSLVKLSLTHGNGTVYVGSAVATTADVCEAGAQQGAAAAAADPPPPGHHTSPPEAGPSQQHQQQPGHSANHQAAMASLMATFYAASQRHLLHADCQSLTMAIAAAAEACSSPHSSITSSHCLPPPQWMSSFLHASQQCIAAGHCPPRALLTQVSALRRLQRQYLLSQRAAASHGQQHQDQHQEPQQQQAAGQLHQQPGSAHKHDGLVDPAQHRLLLDEQHWPGGCHDTGTAAGGWASPASWLQVAAPGAATSLHSLHPNDRVALLHGLTQLCLVKPASTTHHTSSTSSHASAGMVDHGDPSGPDQWRQLCQVVLDSLQPQLSAPSTLRDSKGALQASSSAAQQPLVAAKRWKRQRLQLREQQRLTLLRVVLLAGVCAQLGVVPKQEICVELLGRLQQGMRTGAVHGSWRGRVQRMMSWLQLQVKQVGQASGAAEQ